MKPAKVAPKSLSPDIKILEISVYEEVIQQYVRNLSHRKGVLWIGQLGSLSMPGISDIDLMIICKDEECEDIVLASNEFIQQSPLHRYLFVHEVFVVPYSGIKYLFFFHPLDNLQMLWGDPVILNDCEEVDDTIRLFRAVHWASSNWSKTLHYCNKNSISLRSILVRSKSLVTAAYHNYRLMGNTTSLSNATQQIEQERRQIIRADPKEQVDLAKTSFWNAIQTLAKSDRDLSAWINQEGLFTGSGKRIKIWLSADHAAVFDDSLDFDQEKFHQHRLGMHITHLPFYYYAIGFLVSQPYIRLEPSLTKLWDMKAATINENDKLKHAAEKWEEAFWENVNNFQKVGAHPTALDVYPFNMHKADKLMVRYIKQATSIKFKQWLQTLLVK